MSYQRIEAVFPDGNGATTTAITFEPDIEASVTIVLGHGGGDDTNTNPPHYTIGEALAAAGHRVVLYNFTFQANSFEAQRPADDATATAAAEWSRSRWPNSRLILGGKSRGAHVAVRIVGAGYAVDGLLLISYPLHRPGHPEMFNPDSTQDLPYPVLLLFGTADALARTDFQPLVAARLTKSTLVQLPNADHSLQLPDGGTTAIEDAGGAAVSWIDNVTSSP